MPRRFPPYCDVFRDRLGVLRVYFRRGKAVRIVLPNNLTSVEFREAYAAALAGVVVQRKEPADARVLATHRQPGTIGALIASYKASHSWKKLRETTKAGYKTRIKVLENEHGHRSVRGLTHARIEALLAPYADRPGAALSLLKMLRILIRHAIRTGILAANPSMGIERPRSTEIHSWMEPEIRQFEERWPVGTKERIAFALHLFTGQRRSDVHKMTWADIDGDMIYVVQQKTGNKIWIPIHPVLAAVLEDAGKSGEAIVVTAAGKPFSVGGFSNMMRAAISGAKLPLKCRPHGLRKAQGRRLAEAGCTAHEIMAVLGLKTLAEAERYTRAADQVHLARSGINKLLDGGSVTHNPQTNSNEFGNSPE